MNLRDSLAAAALTGLLARPLPTREEMIRRGVAGGGGYSGVVGSGGAGGPGGGSGGQRGGEGGVAGVVSLQGDGGSYEDPISITVAKAYAIADAALLARQKS